MSKVDGRACEAVFAKLIGGQVIPGSGAGKWSKGDVLRFPLTRELLFRIELKSTNSDRQIFRPSVFEKLEDACTISEIPAFAIAFCDEGTLVPEDTYILLAQPDFPFNFKLAQAIDIERKQCTLFKNSLGALHKKCRAAELRFPYLNENFTIISCANFKRGMRKI